MQPSPPHGPETLWEQTGLGGRAENQGSPTSGGRGGESTHQPLGIPGIAWTLRQFSSPVSLVSDTGRLNPEKQNRAGGAEPGAMGGDRRDVSQGQRDISPGKPPHLEANWTVPQRTVPGAKPQPTSRGCSDGSFCSPVQRPSERPGPGLHRTHHQGDSCGIAQQGRAGAERGQHHQIGCKDASQHRDDAQAHR